MDVDLEHALVKIGLSDKEAKVYLAGLSLGPATVKALSIKSKVRRTTIYEVLQLLKEKELFKEAVYKRKRLFVATHPNQLKVNLNDEYRVLDNIFAELDSISKTEKGKPHVLYHDSLDAVHRAYEQALIHTEKETLGLGSPDIANKLGEEWLRSYIAKRKRLGIIARTVIDSASRWQQRDAVDDRITRVMPNKSPLPVNIEIFDDTVLITSLQGETFCLSVESKRVTDALRSMFEVIWEVSHANG